MGAKRRVHQEFVPYGANPEIFVDYQLEFKGDIIKPGDKIKFRHIRGIFIFVRIAHNVRLDSTWIDCLDQNSKVTRSFHVGKLKQIVRPKRSYKKRAKTVV